MRIVLTDQALRDLATLRAYIEKQNRTAAQEQASLVLSTITLLAEHPQLGRAGRVGGTHELVIPGTRYIAAYVVDTSTIRIIAIIHTSVIWPKAIE